MHNNDICAACYGALSINKNCCQRCASPMELHDGQFKPSESLLCGNCLSHQYFYDQVVSPYLYCEDIRYLITQLKYHKKIHFARILAELFIKQKDTDKEFSLPQIIIPMPMHKRRLRERGFNQALEIARFLARYYSLPIDYNSLIRSRYTDLQAGLAASARQKNVSNAFIIHKAICYQHIAIIDDVMTTGSSANEVAKVLKKANKSTKNLQVDVWTIARAGIKH